MLRRLIEHIDSIIARDPAARSRLEVMLTYPSFHCLLMYRLAHFLWRWRLYLLSRIIAQIARFLTGIEIHPGAKIGSQLFIDHGAGVVIGETTIIGDYVTLYHGVTLGGGAPAIDSNTQRCKKRHPTLEDGVIVGAGAQILGPITVHAEARVGANAVVVNDVPSGVTVVGIPAKVVFAKQDSQKSDFSPYGTPMEVLPDPIANAIHSLVMQVNALKQEIQALQTRQNTDSDQKVPDLPKKEESSRSVGK